jgi:succinyl-CoA synthetase beta subunit
MNLHEYQGKELLSKHGVKIAGGLPATTKEEAIDAAMKVGSGPWVVKAQIHAGGRGKGGGVKFAKTIEDVQKHVNSILGMTLVTKQTGPAGKLVKTIFIQKALDIKTELYLSMLIDRAKGKIAIISSAEGGMEIEEVASKNPEKITTTLIDPITGIQPYHCREVVLSLGLDPSFFKAGTKFIYGLYEAFIKNDTSLIEINPLVVTETNELVALDAKVSIDDNSLFRQKELASLRDLNEENPNETEAINADLSYIALDGNIGCMVNGAGLAMGTMDIIKLHGGMPANFLDVGGSATTEKIIKAFKIILSDQKVNSILVNIFGGIMKCDTIAEGVVAAAKELQINKPLVVRLNGTNVKEGKEILKNSGLKIRTASSLDEAAKLAVASAKEL